MGRSGPPGYRGAPGMGEGGLVTVMSIWNVFLYVHFEFCMTLN